MSENGKYVRNTLNTLYSFIRFDFSFVLLCTFNKTLEISTQFYGSTFFVLIFPHYTLSDFQYIYNNLV